MVVDALKDMRKRLEADAAHDKTEDTPYTYHKPIPEDMWIKCPECKGVMFREDFEKSYSVCQICGHHYRLDSRSRIREVTDAGTFVEWDAGLLSLNPIAFDGYPEKIDGLIKKTGLNEAVVCGQAVINGSACAIAVMDSNFLMGSMGSVVGEKITRLFEQAMELGLPVITFSASGGARMQEGIISLMQMAKTSAAVGRFQDAGGLYISVMTDPTTGGVTASFASLGDIIISEPGTLIGFAGRRVIEGTIAQTLPDGFQRAEFLLEHGFLDMIVHRKQLKNTLGSLLQLHNKEAAETNFGSAETPAASAAKKLTASDCLEVIRHKNRPVISDYLSLMFDDVFEMHGDRAFADDQAMWGGIARFAGQPVTVIGHRKGKTIEENSRTNFGMPHPEGYRKAMRLMKQADKFGRPIVCMVDTSGAYCGVGAEERGQGEAIAVNLRDMMKLSVPVIVMIMGEGGSGGALAIGVGDELAMLSNSLYSVISPRGFASILWKDASREKEAADILHITATDLEDLGICDQIIAEPGGGAHTNLSEMAQSVKSYLEQALPRQMAKSKDERLASRYEKFRRIGSFLEH